MNYEDAFRHYKEGTATEEEKAFVQDELARARALSTLLDDQSLNVKAEPIKEADAKEVREAKQQFLWKRVLAGVLSITILLVILAAVLGGVFGAAAGYAKKSVVVGVDEARALAEHYAWDRATTEGVYVLRNGQRVQMLFEGDAMYSETARDIDEKFQFENNLVDSYYVYRIEVKGFDSVNHYEWEYEIDVNSKTGTCTVHKTEVEYEDDYRRY